MCRKSKKKKEKPDDRETKPLEKLQGQSQNSEEKACFQYKKYQMRALKYSTIWLEICAKVSIARDNK